MKNSNSITARKFSLLTIALLGVLIIGIVTVSALTQNGNDQTASSVMPLATARLEPKPLTKSEEPPTALTEEAPQRNSAPKAPTIASNYSFSTTTTASLTDMSSGTTQLIAADQDDVVSAVTLIGFDFYLNGARQTQFSVNSNGTLRFGSTAISNTLYDPLAQASQSLVTAYGADQRTHAGDGKVHYKVTGSAPNRVLTVEWLNMQANFNSGGTADLTYQVRLSETTGTIEFVYGSLTMSTAGAADVNSNSPQMGFSTNSTVGNVGSITAAQSGTPAPTFSGASATPVNNSYVAGAITVLTSAANGSRRSFLLTPPVVTAPGGPLTFTGVTATAMTLNWTDSANELGYDIFISTDGVNFSFFNTTAQNATSLAVTNLTSSTNYTWRVYAFSEGSTAFLSGAQATPAPTPNTSLGTGLWSSPATWSTGVVPTSNDAVTIAGGTTVTIDTAAVAYSVSVPGTLQFEQTTARTLTVGTDVTVQGGGTFQSNTAGTQTGHNLSITGNLTNNGTLDFSTNADTAGAIITFTGATNNTFSGSGATTDIRQLTINKGTTTAPILELMPTNFTVRGVTTDTVVGGWLVMTNGTLKISGTFSGTSRVFAAAAYTIPASFGFWLNNPNYTVAGQNGSPTNSGLLRVSQGTFNIGTATGNSLGFSTGSTTIVEGGAINAASRFGVATATNAITYTQTAGTITVNTLGNTSTTLGSFDLGTALGSTIALSGGTIVVQLASTGGIDYRNQAGAGITSVTGGTLQMGNAASGAAKTFTLRGVLPNVVVTNTSAGHTATMSTTLVNFNNISRNITVQSGATFNAGNVIFLFAGTTLTNDGTLTHNGASSNFVWFDTGTTGPQTYTGAGTVTAPLTALAFQNSVTFTSTNQVPAAAVRLFTGSVTNANKITLGNGGATTGVVQIGNTTTATAAGSFDVPFTFNLGTGGQTASYLRTTASRSTGPEINPTRTLTSFTYDDNDPTHTLTIAGGDFTTTGTTTLTNGRVVTGANAYAVGSAGTVTRTNGYVDGNLKKNYPAVASKAFEVGTANGYSPVTVNVTGGTPADFTVKAVQGAQPNIGVPSKALQRYWKLTATGVTADLTFNYLDPTDIPVTATEANFVIQKYSGGFTQPGGTVNTAANTATITGVTSFSDWTLAEPGALVSCPSTLTVSDLGDGADFAPGNGVCETATGNGICTLRAAIEEANALAATPCTPLTINFSVTGTISLATALPTLDHPNLTITGPGASALTVQRSLVGGTPDFRIFAINTGKTASISGLTMTNGNTSAGVDGGGILNNGTLSLTAAVITGNTAGQTGGGIRNFGQLTLNNCTISNNNATFDAGVCTSFGPAVIRNTTINGNTATSQSGALKNESGTVTVVNSTVSGNSSGGIINVATTGNSASLTLINCTVNGSGILSAAITGAISGVVNLKNTILNNATLSLADSNTSFVSQGYNLASDDGGGFLTGTGDLINTNPLLGALGNNGGPTQTHALLSGSPAIDKGSAANDPISSNPITTDQRGNTRPVNDPLIAQASSGNDSDIGAFEVQCVTPTITPGGPTTFCIGGSVTLTSSSATGNQWYLNGNPIGGATNQTYTATASGNYTVAVTPDGCTSASTTVTVNPLPPTPTITPGGPTTFCAGGSVVLTSSSATGNQWYQNGNPIGGATNQTYTATASGDYSVVVTASGCPSAPSAATTVTVNPTPTTPTITPGGPTTFCLGGSVLLTSSSATGNQWYQNGNLIGGATNQTYTATASGNYTVITTQNGCPSVASAPMPVTANPAPTTATVGPNQTISPLGTTAGLGGNTPMAGTGMWSVVNGGTGGFNPNATTPNATFTHTGGAGPVVLRWTISNAPCPPSSADVTIFLNQSPVVNVAPVSVAKGSLATTQLLANVSDDMTPVTALTATVNNVASATVNGVTVYGLTINASGQLQGNVATTCAATTATFTLNVTDSANATTNVALTINVTANPGPVLSYASPQTVGVGGSLIVNPLTGPGDNGNVASLVVQSVTPAFTGTINVAYPSGVVTLANAGPVGSFTVVIRATDNCGVFSDASFTLNVNCPTITVNPASLPNGVVGTTYNQTVTASPSGPTYSYAVTSGVLPTGLTLNTATGAITGTPSAGGSYTFAITATAFGTCTATQSYNLLITATCGTVTVNPASLPAGTLGVAYSQTITPTGGTAPYTFAVTSGALPAGLTLNTTTGVLSGTPTTATTAVFTIKATGQGGCNGSRAYVLTIACGTITVNPATLPNGTVGAAYSQTLTASPSGPVYTYSVSLGSLPPGYNLNTATGVLSGTASTTGTYTFTIRAAVGGCNGSRQYTVTIAAGPTAAPLDFDGDHRSEFVRWVVEDGALVWEITRSSDGLTQRARWGTAKAIPVAADYDGDGKVDLAVFDAGAWLIQLSGSGKTRAEDFGATGDLPVVGDYDGDGKADLAVYRGGNWLLRGSRDGVLQVFGLGDADSQPVPADYDGDGRTDLAVFQAGYWRLQLSAAGRQSELQLGRKGDLPLAADFDGDGRADVAVWRASEGALYVGDPQQARVRLSRLTIFDLLQLGDYDGDGRAELAVQQDGRAGWQIVNGVGKTR